MAESVAEFVGDGGVSVEDMEELVAEWISELAKMAV
jgi:hypothetical protein